MTGQQDIPINVIRDMKLKINTKTKWNRYEEIQDKARRRAKTPVKANVTRTRSRVKAQAVIYEEQLRVTPTIWIVLIGMIIWLLYEIRRGLHGDKFDTLISVLFSIILALAFVPRRCQILSDRLRVFYMLSKTEIPFDEIEKVEVHLSSLRFVIGMDEKVVVIKMQSGRNIRIYPTNIRMFVQTLNTAIARYRSQQG